MIPKAFIEQWRKAAPWQNDAQIEQDLVLSRALVEIFRHPQLSNTMRFRGGTALYKLFFKGKVRYSEDIDLVQTDPGAIGQDIDALRETLDPWLGVPKRKRGPGIVTLVYKFTSETEGLPLRLKVEINTREHEEFVPLIHKPFEVKSNWFSGSCKVLTYSLEELMGSKLRALYGRKKGRDLFDCWMALTENAIDQAKTVEAFQHYLTFSKQSVSRAEFEQNIFYKLQDQTFRADMNSLLGVGTNWDIDEAAELVIQNLVSKLPGGAWKGEERQIKEKTTNPSED